MDPEQRTIIEVKNQTNSAPREMIGFRLLEVGDRDELESRAHRLGISVHDLVRDYVIAALRVAEEKFALRDLVSLLTQESLRLRKDLRLATHALLIGAGRASRDEAEEWVSKNLPED